MVFMRNKILGLIICIMAIVGILLFPLKREVSLKKPIKHFIKGVLSEQSEIIIDGEIRYNLLSSKMKFIGDINIEEFHSQLRDVKVEIILDKKETVEVPIIRAGIQDTSIGAEAVNESVGIMRIKGDFDSLILYPIDKNSRSININKDDYWTCDDSGDA